MAYREKYCVKNSHLNHHREVRINELDAEIFLGLANRLDPIEIGLWLFVGGRKLNLDGGTVSNHFQTMYDLVGIESGGKNKGTQPGTDNAFAGNNEKKEKKIYRHRYQLREWAILHKLVIKVNGVWQLNSAFLIIRLATA